MTTGGMTPVGGGGGMVAGAGAGGMMMVGDDCPTQTMGSTAGHVMVMVKWAATTGLAAGMATMHLWNRADLTFSPDGTATGVVHPCGSKPPEFQKMGLAGMNKVQMEFAEGTFDAPGIPTGMASGMLTPPMGSDNPFAVGATIAMEPVGMAIGIEMADPINDPWQMQGMGSKTPGLQDHDGDGNPGITILPHKAMGYDQPPISLLAGLGNAGPFADEVYIATRLVVQLMGTRDSCTTAKGTANVMKLDTRVVGCLVTTGSPCAAAETDFIDANQAILEVVSAEYEMMKVEPTTTCAQVRQMLPAM